MKEGDTVRAILQYLGARGVLCWRMNVGAFKAKTHDEYASDRFIRFGTRGMSDIIGVMPWCFALKRAVCDTNPVHDASVHTGRFLAIEVKRSGQRPTPYQIGFLDQVRKAGGVAFVATSVADVEAVLFP